MELAAHTVLDAAYAGGVRYFDAARSYGKAEAFLATWLARRGFGAGEVTVGSKWGYTYTGGWRVGAPVHEVKDLSVATLRRQFAESREQLGLPLRLYQIHSATLDSDALDDPAVLEDLARLRASGVSIGVTVTCPKQAERRLSARSRSADSTPRRRHGTCWSARRDPRLPRPMALESA